MLRCSKHPDYRGIRKPRVDCQECWEIYFAAQKSKVPMTHKIRMEDGSEIAFQNFREGSNKIIRQNQGLAVQYRTNEDGWREGNIMKVNKRSVLIQIPTGKIIKRRKRDIRV